MKTLAVLGSLVLVTLISAQVATRGDSRARAEPTEFRSPMVLATVFAAADPSLWVSDEWRPEAQKAWKAGAFTIPEYHDLGKFMCDGFCLRGDYSVTRHSWDSGLSMRMRKLEGGRVEVKIRASVTNPSHSRNAPDKVVTLVLDVMDGQKSLASTSMDIKVAANWMDKIEHKDQEAMLVLAADSLKTSPMTKLRITMTTRDF